MMIVSIYAYYHTGLGAGLIVLLLAIAVLLIFAIIIAFRRKNSHRRLKGMQLM